MTRFNSGHRCLCSKQFVGRGIQLENKHVLGQKRRPNSVIVKLRVGSIINFSSADVKQDDGRPELNADLSRRHFHTRHFRFGMFLPVFRLNIFEDGEPFF